MRLTDEAGIGPEEGTMQTFLYIYQYGEDGNSYTLKGSLCDGCLRLDGYDSIPGISHAYGDGEAAYFYRFDAENTQKLIEAFHTDDLLESIRTFYGGKKAHEAFEAFCRANGVAFESEDINLRLGGHYIP